MIARVWLEKGTLQIHFLHDDGVKSQLAAGTFSLAHVDVGSYQILAAQSDDLRKFMQALGAIQLPNGSEAMAFAQNGDKVVRVSGRRQARLSRTDDG